MWGLLKYKVVDGHRDRGIVMMISLKWTHHATMSVHENRIEREYIGIDSELSHVII